MRTRRPAFTLIELLISAALFATVAVMVIAILATSSTVQDAGQRSQGTSSQLQSAMDSLKVALTRSTGTAVTINQDTSAQGGNNSILVLQTCLPSSDCTTPVYQYEVFCVNSDSTSADKTRLLQYVPPSTATLSGSLNSFNSCNLNSIGALFTLSNGTANYLTDSTIKIPSFTVQAMNNANAVANADAFEIELAGVYKGAVGVEVRANTLASTPIIIRDTAVVTSSPVMSNISQ